MILHHEHNGVVALPKVCGPLGIGAAIAVQPGTVVDDEVMDMAKLVLAAHVHGASKRIRSEALGTTSKAYTQATTRLTCGLRVADQHLRWKLEADVVAALPTHALLAYYDADMYDETPVPIVLREWFCAQLLPQVLQGESAHRGTICVHSGGSSSRTLDSKMPRKLSQPEGDCVMCVMVAGSPSIVRFQSLGALTVFERTTAQLQKEALLRCSGVSPTTQRFRSRTRTPSTDRAGSNIACETSICVGRGSSCELLHGMCEVHMVATMYSRVFADFGDHITGMLHFALSLRTGTATRRYRHCLRLCLGSNLVVRRGTPPREATQYQASVLKLFLSRGKHANVRRMSLAFLPRGDLAPRPG